MFLNFAKREWSHANLNVSLLSFYNFFFLTFLFVRVFKVAVILPRQISDKEGWFRELPAVSSPKITKPRTLSNLYHFIGFELINYFIGMFPLTILGYLALIWILI